MKKIICNTPKGQFSIPLQLIAEHRADYYAVVVDGHEKNSPEWNSEVRFVMEDDYEAIDWLLNNTDWVEWKDHATKLNEKVMVTDEDFWRRSDDFTIE